MASESTIFEKIWNGDIPAATIFRSDKHGLMVFLDINPLQYGHVLVIPAKAVDHINDLAPLHYLKLQLVGRQLANHLKQAMQAERIMQLVVGYDVPHAHLHLVPSHGRDDSHNILALHHVESTPAKLDALRSKLALLPQQAGQLEGALDMLDQLDGQALGQQLGAN